MKRYPIVFLATFTMAIEAIVVELFYVVLQIPTLVIAIIAIPIAGAILLISSKNNIKLLKKEYKAILLMLVFFTITEFTWYSAISYIGASKTQLIEVPLETLAVIALAWIFLHERLDKYKMLGAALVIAGVIVSFNISVNNQAFGIGEILITIASISGAITIIIITKLLENYDTKQITGFSLLFSGLILQFQWFFMDKFDVQWSWYLLLTPIIPLAVFFLQNLSYKRVGASLTSIIVTTHMILVVLLQVMLYYADVPVLLPENLMLAFIGGSVSIMGIVIIICAERNLTKRELPKL